MSRKSLWIALLSVTAVAGSWPVSTEPLSRAIPANEMIHIEYVPPTSHLYRATYEQLRARRVLEELSTFLSPLRLPYKIKVVLSQCDQTNSYYRHGEGVTICYEWPDFVARIASTNSGSEGLSRRADILVGAFVHVVLHEIGHAVFDQLQVPILGREEDAADQIAALVMLHFGKDLARRTLTGAAEFWRAVDAPDSSMRLADDHATELQRFYNLLCIAYGGQPGTFQDLVDDGTLPRERAVECRREFHQVRFAFAKTIWPHIDQERLKAVQAMDWANWRK